LAAPDASLAIAVCLQHLDGLQIDAARIDARDVRAVYSVAMHPACLLHVVDCPEAIKLEPLATLVGPPFQYRLLKASVAIGVVEIESRDGRRTGP
jgi:hypothetical protein